MTENTVFSSQGGLYNGDTMTPGTFFYDTAGTTCLMFPATDYHLCTAGVFTCCSRAYGSWTGDARVTVTTAGTIQITSDGSTVQYSQARASSVFHVWTLGPRPPSPPSACPLCLLFSVSVALPWLPSFPTTARVGKC